MSALYTTEMLALAVSLADYPLSPDLPLRAEARSTTCGSRLELGLATDENGRIARTGAMVSACAVGQSAAALFLREGRGRTSGEIQDAARAIETWLSGAGPEPDWPGIGILAPIFAHPGRHGAVLLPWKAARTALAKQAVRG